MIWPIAEPTDAIAVPNSRVAVDGVPARITWPAMPNGIATALATTDATRNVSARIPNTRQRPLRTNAYDLVIASMTGSLSSTISTGANNTMVYRYTINAMTTRTSGRPKRTAAAPLPTAANSAIITATKPNRAATTAASSSARPSNGSSRPRILAQVSPIVIDDPNTARPTMTVSMPDRSMPPSQVTSRPAAIDAIHVPTT